MVFIGLYFRNFNCWWLVKINKTKFDNINFGFDIKDFDNFITYLIISLLIGEDRIRFIL